MIASCQEEDNLEEDNLDEFKKKYNSKFIDEYNDF